MSIIDKELTQYKNILYCISLLVKGKVIPKKIPKDKNLTQWLAKLMPDFIFRDFSGCYVLPNTTKFMLVTSIIELTKTNNTTYYTIQLVECFFTQQTKNIPLATYNKPLHLQLTLPSKIPLRNSDILLIKLPKFKKTTLIHEFSKKSFIHVLHFFKKIKHPINAIIRHNLTLAKKINTYTIKEKFTSINTQTQQTTTRVCLIVQKNKEFVAQDLQDKTIIKPQASRRSLIALGRFNLVLLNKKNEIQEVIGNITHYANDKKIAMLVHNYTPTSFNKQAIKQAQNNIQNLAYKKGEHFYNIESKKAFDNTKRYDITHLPFCTIDPENAKDHDDAIYYDKDYGILYIAIADVSAYVAQDSPLDFIALRRAFSLYFPDEVFPMLPHELSSNICSLKPFTQRLALVWEIRLHKKHYTILRSRVFKAIINVQASLTYHDANLLLNNKKLLCYQNNKVIKSLQAFHKIAKSLYKKRRENGFDFHMLEYDFEIKNENIENACLQKKTDSHMIIEEAMLLANKESAKLLLEIQCGIFRNHKSPSQHNLNAFEKIFTAMGYKALEKKKISVVKNSKDRILQKNKAIHTNLKAFYQQIKKAKEKKLFDFLLVRHFCKAIYETKNQGHFGLGFSSYTHFTSPIRRYTDLMIHRLISAYLEKDTQKMQQTQRKCKEILAHINALEVQYNSIETFYKKLKMLRYAKNLLPFDERVFIFAIKNGVAYGLPLQKIGYCKVAIACEDFNLQVNTLINIKVTGVDFESLCLRGVTL